MKFFWFLALGLLIAPGAVAQNAVHLQGKVTDLNGRPARDAQVTVTDTASKATISGAANSKGKYSIEFVPKKGDTYTVSATAGSLASAPRPLDLKHVPDEMNFSVGSPNAAANEPSYYKFSTDVLQSGTPVKLALQENLSSGDARPGQQVAFKVVDDVIVNGYLLISHGALAKGTVTEARAKRRMGRAGKLDIGIDYVLLADGEHAALSATKDSKGNGRGAAVTVGVAATAIVFFPAAPLFLLMQGKDVKIPEGSQVTAFTNRDIYFDSSKFEKVKMSK